MPQQTHNQLTDNVAGNARLIENRHCEFHYPGLQQCVLAKHKDPETSVLQPVFKVATTGFPASKQIAAPLGKENMSPQKEIRMPNVAVIGPWSAEMYPRQPARSVYTSPLIANDEAALLIFENRYRSKSTERLPASAALKDETESPLNANIYVGYDLDQLVNNFMTSNRGSTVVIKNILNSAHKEVQESLPKNLNLCTGEVKKVVETSRKSSMVTSPNTSPVRVPPKFDNFNKEPLASSTVNSPKTWIYPKLSNILASPKTEFQNIKHNEPYPEFETPKVLSTDSEPALPTYRSLEETPISASSYNVDSFLRDGSEQFSRSISSINSESDFAEDSNMGLVSRDFVPEVRTPTTDRDTLSKESLSVKLGNTADYQRPVLQSSLSLQTSGGNNDRVKRLIQEASIQRILVAQTSKAVRLCRKLKQFKESRELVEAERILLLANLRCQAAQDEIKKCGSPPLTASRASLKISDINVPLRSDNVLLTLDRNLCPQWFVCVLIEGETVQATEAVQLIYSEPMLKFQTSMHLSDLSCDFRGSLQLYAFPAPQYSKKGKRKILRACKMLHRPIRNCWRTAENSEELIRPSAFTIIGCTELTVELIGKGQPVSCILEQVPMVSPVKRTINFRLSAELLNICTKSGFLNVLRPAGEYHTWQRWWCHLDGKALQCWNYPSDQEEKEPVLYINLIRCPTKKVVPAPRVLCSRPRTLLLESQRVRGPHDFDSTLLACSRHLTTVRHFLSCDSAAEMTEWSSSINECFDALLLWPTKLF